MYVNANFDTALDILHRSMNVNLLRQDVIANNIANSDTPNFKRTVVNFETQLRDALLPNDHRGRLAAARTDSQHIPFRTKLNYQDVRPRRVLDFQTSSKNNDNNVDIEVESSNLLNTQLLYTLLTTSVSEMFQRVNIVLT